MLKTKLFSRLLLSALVINGVLFCGSAKPVLAGIYTLPTPTSFAFSPAITSVPEAMNYTGSGYVVQPSALRNITVNAPKRFQIKLTNHSNTKTTATNQLGLNLAMDGAGPLEWDESFFEKAWTNSENTDSNGTQALNLNRTWNTLSGLANSIFTNFAPNSAKYLRFRATPKLISGTAPTSLNTHFQTFVKYILGTRTVAYRGGELADTNTSTVYNTPLEIIGTLHSAAGVFDKTNQQINRSIGDLSQSEARANIMRNVRTALRDFEEETGGADVTINNLQNLPSNVGLDKQKNPIFVAKGDVTFTSNSGKIALAEQPLTLVVIGSDVRIKSNLIAASNGNTSFGIIVLRDPETGAGGNIYVYPNVTNLLGAVFAEGSVMSVNRVGKSGEYIGNDCPANGLSGFCDRSIELRNQLYWQGSIISQNTIGGSDQTPAVCPSIVTEECTRDVARKYDFAYLRTFHTDACGQRAGRNAPTENADGTCMEGALDSDLTPPPGGANNNNAVIIQYDGRLKTNPPPLFADVDDGQSSELGN